jgi:hypothetical protein
MMVEELGSWAARGALRDTALTVDVKLDHALTFANLGQSPRPQSSAG